MSPHRQCQSSSPVDGDDYWIKLSPASFLLWIITSRDWNDISPACRWRTCSSSSQSNRSETGQRHSFMSQTVKAWFSDSGTEPHLFAFGLLCGGVGVSWGFRLFFLLIRSKTFIISISLINSMNHFLVGKRTWDEEVKGFFRFIRFLAPPWRRRQSSLGFKPTSSAVALVLMINVDVTTEPHPLPWKTSLRDCHCWQRVPLQRQVILQTVKYYNSHNVKTKTKRKHSWFISK